MLRATAGGEAVEQQKKGSRLRLLPERGRDSLFVDRERLQYTHSGQRPAHLHEHGM
jgi:hypothetical protein